MTVAQILELAAKVDDFSITTGERFNCSIGTDGENRIASHGDRLCCGARRVHGHDLTVAQNQRGLRRDQCRECIIDARCYDDWLARKPRLQIFRGSHTHIPR